MIDFARSDDGSLEGGGEKGLSKSGFAFLMGGLLGLGKGFDAGAQYAFDKAREWQERLDKNARRLVLATGIFGLVSGVVGTALVFDGLRSGQETYVGSRPERFEDGKLTGTTLHYTLQDRGFPFGRGYIVQRVSERGIPHKERYISRGDFEKQVVGVRDSRGELVDLEGF